MLCCRHEIMMTLMTMPMQLAWNVHSRTHRPNHTESASTSRVFADTYSCTGLEFVTYIRLYTTHSHCRVLVLHRHGWVLFCSVHQHQSTYYCDVYCCMVVHWRHWQKLSLRATWFRLPFICLAVICFCTRKWIHSNSLREFSGAR